MCRVAFLAVQRQALCLELHRARQAQLVASGLLVQLDLRAPLAPLGRKAFKVLLAPRGKLDLRAPRAQRAQQVRLLQLLALQARPDLLGQQDRQAPRVRQELKVRKATLGLRARQALQAPQDQLVLLAIRASKVLLALQAQRAPQVQRGQLVLLGRQALQGQLVRLGLRVFRALLDPRGLQDRQGLQGLLARQGRRVFKALRGQPGPRGLLDLRVQLGRPGPLESKDRLVLLGQKVIHPACSCIRQTLGPHLAIRAMGLSFGKMPRRKIQHM